MTGVRHTISGLTLAVLACAGGSETEPSPDFLPTSDTTLGGNVSFRSVTVPAGVTVNSGVLYLKVSQDLVIAGTWRAPCVVLHFDVVGTVTVTGTIDNSCPIPSDSGGSLTIIGRSSWSMTGASIASSGDLAIVNSPSDTLPASSRLFGSTAPGPRQSNASSWRCQLIESSITTSPASRRAADDSTAIGKNGRPGANRLLGCGHSAAEPPGGSLLIESSSIIAGNGGKGGGGLLSASGQGQGGLGGAPGGIVLSAEDDIEIRGVVSLVGGDAGAGGGASLTGANGDPGVSVVAIGGRGGELIPRGWPASLSIRAGGSVTQSGILTIRLGSAGNGGVAVATGGNGIPTRLGAAGGSSTAIGGEGGNAAGAELIVAGALNLTGQIDLNGGAGGAGGDATCLGGLGGPGSVAGAPGGNGGAITCEGGAGGKGLLAGSGPLGLSSQGGRGGGARVSGAANGGFGAGSCAPTGLGGAGGAGGTVLARGGAPGIGMPNGAAGGFEIVTSANGGRGGNGAPPGSGGGAGTNASSTGATLLTDSFAAGLSGLLCQTGIGFATPTRGP